MRNKEPNVFGKEYLEIFNVGDCVSYSTLEGAQIFGIISKIYIDDIENDKNRKCAFAEVINMHGDSVPIILMSIKLESKAKRHESKIKNRDSGKISSKNNS